MPKSKEADLVEEIRLRWQATKLVLLWTDLPKKQREEVTAEFEETARQIGDTNKQLSESILIALDCLDVVGDAAQAGLYGQACSDVGELLRLLQKRSV